MAVYPAAISELGQGELFSPRNRIRPTYSCGFLYLSFIFFLIEGVILFFPEGSNFRSRNICVQVAYSKSVQRYASAALDIKSVNASPDLSVLTQRGRWNVSTCLGKSPQKKTLRNGEDHSKKKKSIALHCAALTTTVVNFIYIPLKRS